VLHEKVPSVLQRCTQHYTSGAVFSKTGAGRKVKKGTLTAEDFLSWPRNKAV